MEEGRQELGTGKYTDSGYTSSTTANGNCFPFSPKLKTLLCAKAGEEKIWCGAEKGHTCTLSIHLKKKGPHIVLTNRIEANINNLKQFRKVRHMRRDKTLN